MAAISVQPCTIQRHLLYTRSDAHVRSCSRSSRTCCGVQLLRRQPLRNTMYDLAIVFNAFGFTRFSAANRSMTPMKSRAWCEGARVCVGHVAAAVFTKLPRQGSRTTHQRGHAVPLQP